MPLAFPGQSLPYDPLCHHTSSSSSVESHLLNTTSVKNETPEPGGGSEVEHTLGMPEALGSNSSAKKYKKKIIFRRKSKVNKRF